MPTITIALLGPREGAFTEAALAPTEEERDRRWEDREQIVLEVAEDEALGQILKRAGEQLQVAGYGQASAPVPNFFALHGTDETTVVGYGTVVHVVDAHGHATWNIPFAAATYGDLVVATEHRSMPGDPTRFYYVTHPGIGNGVLITWLQVLEGLAALWKVAEVMSTIDGSLSFGERLKDLFGRSKEAAELLGPERTTWEGRGGEPHAIRAMLLADGRPWNVDDLAQLLGTSPDVARALLWAFGFAEEGSGLWRWKADDAGAVLDTAFDEMHLAYSLGHDEYEETLERRLDPYLRTGERAPRPFVDAIRYGDEKRIPKFEGFDELDLASGDEGNGFDHFDERVDPWIPVEKLTLGCDCGKESCHVAVEFSIANGQLKLGFTTATDHFVVNPTFMTAVAEQMSETIDQAKNPRD